MYQKVCHDFYKSRTTAQLSIQFFQDKVLFHHEIIYTHTITSIQYLHFLVFAAQCTKSTSSFIQVVKFIVHVHKPKISRCLISVIVYHEVRHDLVSKFKLTNFSNLIVLKSTPIFVSIVSHSVYIDTLMRSQMFSFSTSVSRVSQFTPQHYETFPQFTFGLGNSTSKSLSHIVQFAFLCVSVSTLLMSKFSVSPAA